MRRTILCFIVLTIFMGNNLAQSSEEARVISTLTQLFDGMRAGDSAMVRAVFHPEARLQSAFISRDGETVLATEEISKFVEAVGTPHDEVWDERIWSYDIHVDGNLATAWAEYTFFRGEQLSHCGVDAFQLFNDGKDWKIIQITDTRRRTGCATGAGEDQLAINQFMDAWHKAAANADEVTFFSAMTIDAVYLGTDASEYWRRDEMKAWAQPYFDKDSAWAFSPKSRHVYLSSDKKMAWFDELLDTWMGTCRGSGVLVKEDAAWKIKHYNLAVTVPNDLINQYIEMLKTLPSKN